MVAFQPALVIKRDPDDCVARKLLSVPGTVKRHKGVILVFLREHLSGIELDTECSYVRSEEHIRNDRLPVKIWALALASRILVLRYVSIWPPVEAAFLNRSSLIGYKIVTQSVAFIDCRPELPGFWVPRKADRV